MTLERTLNGPFELLAEMSQAFADTLDIDRTFELALATIAKELGAEAGSLWLLEDGGQELTCRASVGPKDITGLRLGAGQGIVGRSVRENACQSILDVEEEPDFARKVDKGSGFETRSLLCAPMSVKDQALGAIELVNKKGEDGRFAPEDAHLLQALASSAALATQNARMAGALVEHERVKRELELAAEIQRNLLPAHRPAPFPLFGINFPARTVSGDFFDILPLPDGRIAFCLGDVSGKGMNAALLMAKTASLYRCLAKSIEGPGRVLGMLNEELCETSTRGYYVTMAAGTLDPKAGTAVIANAGHEPVLCHGVDGEFESVEAEAPPLGILVDAAPDGAYPEVEVRVGRGLYLFSDGLTEACREGGDALGAEGARDLIQRFESRPLAERVQAIAAAVGECELRDDLTLLGVSADPWPS
jgi:sigma-B regulation protein RsbU (phosphoserine phosphatase)